MTNANTTQQTEPEPMIERRKFDALANELAWLRQRTREMQAELEMRRQRENEDGSVWYWQTEGGNYINSLSNSCVVAIRASDLRALLDARPFKPANDHIRHDVIDQAYDFIIDWDGNVAGLIAGDHGYECTGIKLSAETMKDFMAKQDSDEDLAMQARLYQRGTDKRLDDVLDQFEFQASDATTWWHVIDFLHHHGHHLNAGLAYQYAMPILPRSGAFAAAPTTKAPIKFVRYKALSEASRHVSAEVEQLHQSFDKTKSAPK